MAQSSTNKKILIVDTSQAEQSITRLKLQVKQLTAAYEKSDQRTLESKVIKDKLTNATNQLTAATKRETTSVNTESNAHANSTKAIQLRINKLREEMQVMDMSSDEYKTATANMMSMNASMQEGARSTGLAATSAMEFGRVISDAPYGIRGMANNVSQLTSLLFQGARATDAATGKMIGLSGSIKGMWTAMMGPLGIMIAIQAVIAALDYFNNTAADVDSTLSKLGKEGVTTMTTKLNLLVKITNDSTIALETKRETVRRANEEIKDLNAELDENGNLTQDSVANIQAMTTELMKVAKAAAAVDLIKDLNKELVKLQIESLGFGDKALLAFKNFFTGADIGKTWAEEQAADIEGKAKTIQDKIDEIFNIGKDQEFLPQIFGEDDPKGGKVDKALKEFKGKIFDLQKYILGLNKETVLSQERNVMKRLKIEQGYAKAELDLKLKLFVDKERQRRDDFIKKANNQQEIDDANKTFNNMEFQAEGEHSMAMRALKLNNTSETAALEREIREQAAIDSQAAELKRVSEHLDLMNELLDENDPNSLAVLQEKQRAIWEVEDQLFEEDLERKREKMEMEGYSELEIQTIIDDEKYAYSAQRAADEIQLERDTIESKKAIQQEYVGFIQGIGQVLSTLGKKQKALAIVGLAIEKGSAIAGIIIEASKSNAIAAAEGTAYAAKTMSAYASIPIAGPTIAASLIAANNLRSAASVSKTNIGAGISIAKIAATTLTSKALGGSSSGGGGGGGSAPAPSFTPSFDVVGNSGQNQLAQGISNQINQPTRAYVVYEDIQEAGDINDNAVESSGI